MAAYHIYVDESGKISGKSEYTALCGYVAHVQEWNRVGLEWDACRLRFGVPPIHMSRIMSPDNKNDEWTQVKEKWGNLWESKRNRMLKEFSLIIARASIACVGAVVDANAYRRLKKEPDCLLHYEDSNVFAFHNAIMSGLEKIEAVDKSSSVSIVVDDDQENAFGYYGMLTTLKTHPSELFQKVKDRIRGICFCEDSNYPGLQAADMIAFIARRYKVECREEKDSNFDIVPFNLYADLTNGGIHQPKFYTEDILYKIAKGTKGTVDLQKQSEHIERAETLAGGPHMK